jgi:hypothetical protein
MCHAALIVRFSLLCAWTQLHSYLGVLIRSSVTEMASILAVLDGIGLLYDLIVPKMDIRTEAEVQQLREQASRICARKEQQPLRIISAQQRDKFDWTSFTKDIKAAAMSSL